MSPTLPSLHACAIRVAVAFLGLAALSSPALPAPTWDVVPGPNPPSESLLRSVVAISDDEAWAVGSLQSPSYENRSLVAHYVNGAWTVVPSPSPGPACTDGNVAYGGNRLHALAAVSASDIWSVGTTCLDSQTLIEHWDGVSWSVVPSPSPLAENILSDVAAVASNDVWAAGYTEEDVGAGTLVEHWEGASWSVVASPHPGTGGMLSGVRAVSASDVWAVGSYYDDQAELWKTLALHWDGSAWSVVPTPNPGTYSNGLGSIAVVTADDVWAMGSFSSGAGFLTLAEHWDGHQWTVVPTPNVASEYGASNTLGSLVARSANDVWSAGTFQNEGTGHQSRTLLAHWDGASWSFVPSPSPGASSALGGIAFGPSGEAWGVGIYSEYPIDIYDGHYTMAQALTLGTGPDGTVDAGASAIPGAPALGHPIPNPTAGSTSFALALPKRGNVAVGIFDIRGRKVQTISLANVSPGRRTVVWDGRDNAGVRCPSGLYYARLAVDGTLTTSRAIVLVPGRE